MVIYYDSLRGKISEFDKLPLEEIQVLSDALSFIGVGSSYSKQVRQGNWNGMVRLLTGTGTFPAGLCFTVQSILEEFGHKVILAESGAATAPGRQLNAEFTGKLYPFQEDAVKSVLASETPYGIIHSPPRSGKTVMAAKLIAEVNQQPVLFLCERLDIGEQTITRFKEFISGPKIGRVMDGEVDLAPITVCTIQSLLSALNFTTQFADEKEIPDIEKARVVSFLKSAKFVIFDEVHHASSPSAQYIGKFLKSKTRIVGLSGTPFRQDGTDLLMHGLCGPIVYSISIEELQRLGILAPALATFFTLPSIKEDSPKSFQEEYKRYITDNPVRNKVISIIARKLQAKNKSILILVRYISHAENLKKLLPEARIMVASGKSKVDLDDRTEYWDDIRQKKQLISITTLADEGMDIVNLDATIIAAGGASQVKTLQRLRCLTSALGKERALVVDFIDQGHYLSKHSQSRMSTLKKAGIDIKKCDSKLLDQSL